MEKSGFKANNNTIPPLVIITGAGGAIGRELVKALLRDTKSRLILGYFSKQEIPADLDLQNDRIKIIVGDLTDRETLCRLDDLCREEVVLFHFASSVDPQAYAKKWSLAYKFSADATFAVLDWVKTRVFKTHIIYPSSGGTVYSGSEKTPRQETAEADGATPYGIQKRMFENYLRLLTAQNKKVTCTVLRISNPYGLTVPRDRQQDFIDVTLQKILNDEEIIFWVDPATVIRDFIYISDLTAAFKKAISYQNGFEVFNIGSGTGTSLRDIFDLLSGYLNKKVLTRCISSELSENCLEYNVLDIAKAKRLLKWSPLVSVESGIRKVLEAEKTNEF